MRPGLGLLRECDPNEARDLSSDVWLTPPEVIEALGPFDLDPCAWEGDPTRCAARGLTVHDDGLAHDWEGRVWCNPPYSDCTPWLRRMAEHGNGIALTHAQTCAGWFHEALSNADAVGLVRGRISFLRPAWVPTSKKGSRPAYPSVLFAFGSECAARLASPGHGISVTVLVKP